MMFLLDLSHNPCLESKISSWSARWKQALHSLRPWSRKNLSKAKLYLSPRPEFTGGSSSFENARYVVCGVPYDSSSTYKPGSRFGPGGIRDVSANLELYSIRSNVDLEKVPVHDMGDV